MTRTEFNNDKKMTMLELKLKAANACIVTIESINEEPTHKQQILMQGIVTQASFQRQIELIEQTTYESYLRGKSPKKGDIVIVHELMSTRH